MKYSEIMLTISAKPDGVGAVCQPLIPQAEHSGLPMRTVTTGKRFVIRADEKLTAFLELERAVCISLLTEQL